MDGVIRDHGLAYHCQGRMLRETGDSAYLLDHFDVWDDGSDVEEEPDSAAVAAAAVADQQALVAAVGGAVEHHALRLEIERLRMRLEDKR